MQDTHPVYAYHFEHAKSTPGDVAVLVPHASELPYVLHRNSESTTDASDSHMADYVASYWGNFLLSAEGDPNELHVGVGSAEGPSGPLPKWPKYSRASDEVLALPQDNQLHAVASLKKAECDFWNPRLALMIKGKYPESGK